MQLREATRDAHERLEAGAGADTGRRWAAFLAQLETAGATANMAHLIAGAQTAFSALEQLATSTMAATTASSPHEYAAGD